MSQQPIEELKPSQEMVFLINDLIEYKKRGLSYLLELTEINVVLEFWNTRDESKVEYQKNRPGSFLRITEINGELWIMHPQYAPINFTDVEKLQEKLHASECANTEMRKALMKIEEQFKLAEVVFNRIRNAVGLGVISPDVFGHDLKAYDAARKDGV